jgi:hypothetical protein
MRSAELDSVPVRTLFLVKTFITLVMVMVALGLIGVLIVLWLTLRFVGVVRRGSARQASSW